MTTSGRSSSGVTPWVIVAGGLLMAVLWLVFTWLHGPTSYQEDNEFLGGGVHFWGMLLGVLPNSLLAGGLIALRWRLTVAGRMAAVGYGLTCGALVVPAVLDVAVQAINAPFFLPVQAVGVIVLAAGLRAVPGYRRLRMALVVLGGLLGTSMLLAFLPEDFSDSIGGFRLFGTFGYFLAGLAWSVVGYQLWRGRSGRR